jgi:hypothetical protein
MLRLAGFSRASDCAGCPPRNASASAPPHRAHASLPLCLPCCIAAARMITSHLPTPSTPPPQECSGLDLGALAQASLYPWDQEDVPVLIGESYAAQGSKKPLSSPRNQPVASVLQASACSSSSLHADTPACLPTPRPVFWGWCRGQCRSCSATRLMQQANKPLTECDSKAAPITLPCHLPATVAT